MQMTPPLSDSSDREPLRSVRSRNHTITVVDLLGFYLGFVNGGSSLSVERLADSRLCKKETEGSVKADWLASA